MTDAITRDDVLHILTKHIGSERGATATALVTEILGYSTPADERQLRHRIEELRREGQHICGLPGGGYYVARDEAELVRTCSYLFARAMTSLAQVAAMRRVSLPDLRGQLRLPTEQQAAGDLVSPSADQRAVSHNTRSASALTRETS